MRFKRAFTLIELPVVRKRAFTLIELLVVIAIIGILATVVILNVSKARAKAADAKIKSDIGTLARAVDIHLMYYNAIPQWIQTNKNSSYTPLSDGEVSSFVDDSVPLMAKAPIHPLNGSSCSGSGAGSERSKTYCSGYYPFSTIYYVILYYASNDTVNRNCYWYKPSSSPNFIKDCKLNF